MDPWGEQHLHQSFGACACWMRLWACKGVERCSHFPSSKLFTEHAKPCSSFCVSWKDLQWVPRKQIVWSCFLRALSSAENPAADASVKSGWEEFSCFAESWWSCAEIRWADLPWPRACVIDDSNVNHSVRDPNISGKCLLKEISSRSLRERDLLLREKKINTGGANSRKSQSLLKFWVVSYSILDDLHQQAQFCL